MKRCASTVAALLAFAMGALGQTLTKEQLARVDFEQHLRQRAPLNAMFRDESGAPVRLGAFFGQRPVLLALAYYECPNLCTLVLNGVLESTRNLRLDAGRDFEIVVVSIHPGDTPARATTKKQTYTTRYGRPGSAQGWHFLTGDAEPIRQVSEAVGFRSVYDPASKQYAHPSGVVVLTPDGVISRYFLGIEYPPKDLRLALVEASQHRIGSLADRLLLLCFHYDPMTGRYSLLITRVLQVAGSGTVLLLAALIMRLARSRESRLEPEGHPPGGGSPPLLLIATWSLLPERASDIARSVDAIFYALLVVCGLVTAGVGAAVLYFCVRYRAGSPAKRPAGDQTSVALEIVWTSATLLVFLGIFVWAAVVYFRMSRPPANASEIHVVARQWMWKAQHPNGRREINELHLLLNRPVKLLMTSQDVIHDFFVPAFRTKQDVLPSRYTVEWFTPTRPGKYHLFCAEYCGLDHSRMGGWIYVLEPADYARWLAEQQSGESMVAAGARLFQARGCSGCHAPNATVRAPLLNGIYKKPVALADGTVAIADDQYLHDSILLPMKQITAGYAPVMPTFQGQLGEEEVMELIAYLKALGDDGQGGAR
ncbi:MAG: cytochrome c oxidase subunit [Chthoniobacter sp.]|jgi:cytochrome c oxidase subunit 2|nr:cytochrome c oxidase subunit [Chthoniobacter sp.]